MTDDRAAFSGTYSDWKLIKTRSCVQVVIEVDLSAADAAYQVLGGMPSIGESIWLEVSRIVPEQERKVTPSDRPQDSTLEGRHESPPRSNRNPKPVGAEKAKREWREMAPAQQAGIRCNEPSFWKFLNEQHGYNVDNVDLAAEAVRELCRVKSRSELTTNHKARVIWHQFDGAFLEWMHHPELTA